jgi:hypothetical protein
MHIAFSPFTKSNANDQEGDGQNIYKNQLYKLKSQQQDSKNQ